MVAGTKTYKPVRLVPFELKDISDFLNQDHPEYFPHTLEYDDYWEEQVKYCIEGKWGHDFDETKEEKGGWRWMPGNLYFYVNMAEIEDTTIRKETIMRKPLLRDVEWLVYYGLAACDGFSGFENDDKYTCLEAVKHDKDPDYELTGLDEAILEEYDEEIRNPETGEYKEYVEPRDYLYQTFDKPMGRALYGNPAKNMILLSTRGAGKSYMMASCLAHDFTFNGARTVEDFWLEKTKSITVLGAYDSKYSSDLAEKVTSIYDGLMHKPGGYKKNGHNIPGYLYHPYDGQIDDSGDVMINSVAAQSEKGGVGVGSMIYHVSFYNKPQAAVGKRAKRVVVEEAGLLENFRDVHRENKGTQSRDVVFGSTIYIGTGGNMKKIQGIKRAFNNPYRYNVLPYPDHFSGSKKEVGLFIPAYYRKNLYKNKQGNTDYIRAYNDEMRERERIKTDEGSHELDGHVISYPVVPSEMFLEAGENAFDTARAQKRIIDLEEGLWREKATVGQLRYEDKDQRLVTFDPDLENKLNPIVRLNDEDQMKNVEGAPIIYEPPMSELPEPRYKRAQYLVLYDPVANEEGGSSLCSVIVFKNYQLSDWRKMQYTIVAEWVGRYDNNDKNHEMAMKFAHFYNAKVLFEYNNNHIIGFCRRKRKFDMLQPRPGLALDGLKVKQRNNYDYGVKISPTMKPELEIYANEYLNTELDRKESITSKHRTVDKITVIDQMYSLRMLDEIVAYRREGNYDHISSLFLLSLYVDENFKMPADEMEKVNEQENIKELQDITTHQHINDYNPAFDW